MELKKNPNADLNKRSTIYMQIGLIAVLLFTWAAIESKAYTKEVQIENVATADLLDDDWAENVKVEPPKVAPPKPVVVVQKLEVIDDEKDVVETVIDSTEPEEDEAIQAVENVQVAEEDEDLAPVPFNLIEDAPVFPGCEGLTKSDRKACFTKMIHKHVRKNFQYPETAKDMGIQGRVYVSFMIAENGLITNIQARGDRNLEQEAKRIIAKLPKMTPGKQRGKAVRVPFSIPITFKLAD